jgi:serine/threonine protein kinase
VKWLSDAAVDHLRQVADWPDVSGTRYELLDKIGQGGMAAVYLAHDKLLDRPIALKVINIALADSQVRERLLDEARVVARLEHPGIVPVHDAGCMADGRVFYAMKLVRGKRLDEHLTAETSLTDRLRLYEKICQAVAFAHVQGVLHRDLKPQNVMVGAFGEVLVLDWGVAKRFDTDASVAARIQEQCGPRSNATTDHGLVLGTPGYMAPEQARGALDLIDERTDVYGLGAILYFLLTSRAPLGTGLLQVTPPRRFLPSLPRPIEAVCLKALAPAREQRYAGVAELADDIARFLAGLPVTAYPEGVFETTVRLTSRYRAAIILVLAYLLMRVLLLIFTGA